MPVIELWANKGNKKISHLSVQGEQSSETANELLESLESLSNTPAGQALAKISSTTVGNVSAGVPGGSDTQIQFNDGGSFAGDSAFTWDKTENILTIDGLVIDGPTISTVAGNPLGIHTENIVSDNDADPLEFRAGSVDGAGTGAFIDFIAGTSTGGDQGYIRFYSQDEAQNGGAVINTAFLTEDRTFAFPDESGTFALASDIVSDHGNLTGLSDDDHTQYIYNAPAADSRNVIQPASAGIKGLVAKAHASQSDDIFQVTKSDDRLYFGVESSGDVRIGRTADVSSGTPHNESFKLYFSKNFWDGSQSNRSAYIYAHKHEDANNETILDFIVNGISQLKLGNPGGGIIVSGLAFGDWTMSGSTMRTVNGNPGTIRGENNLLTLKGTPNGSNPGIATDTDSSTTGDLISVRNNGSEKMKIDKDGKLAVFAGFADAVNIVVGSTSGTKIGTATTQKLGFYNATPVVQPTALTAADASAVNSGDATTDTVIGNMRTRINELETKLQSLGLLA